MTVEERNKLKEAKLNHKRAIGTPKFEADRMKILNRIVTSRTPRWGNSLKVEMVKY